MWKVIFHLVSKRMRSTQEKKLFVNMISADVYVYFKSCFIWGARFSSWTCIPGHVGETPISRRGGGVLKYKIPCYPGFEFSEKYPTHWASVFLLGDVSMELHSFQEIWVLSIISGNRHGSCRNYMGLSVSLLNVFAAVGWIPEGVNNEIL